MTNIGKTTFLGWHKNCGGIVQSVTLTTLLGYDVYCDKCICRRSSGSLGVNDITPDPEDPSVVSLITSDMLTTMSKHLKYF